MEDVLEMRILKIVREIDSIDGYFTDKEVELPNRMLDLKKLCPCLFLTGH